MSETKPRGRTPLEQLGDILGEAGVTVTFGLSAQGHVPTIERMLADGEGWPAIGRAIGWCPDTAKRHWQWHTAAAKGARDA